ncbi:MAG: hypothetical protein IJT98_11530 [Prevotella sp.]|nr:hypothetical protein [Prevotella sp.]
METKTVRKVVDVTDTPITTIGGQKLIRRVEKILMPNGHYRYPVTYIEDYPGFRVVTRDEWNARRNPARPAIKLAL